MYICVKLTLGYLNPVPCPLLPTSIYICGMTIAPRVHGGQGFFIISIFCCKNKVRWEKCNPITWFVVAVMILIGAIPMASGLDYSKWFMVQRKLQLSQLAISKTTTKVCPCISSSILYEYLPCPCKKLGISHKFLCELSLYQNVNVWV